MTKKRSSEFFAAKLEIFSEKPVILVREHFFRPPKLGARFPPLNPAANKLYEAYKHVDLIRPLYQLL